MPSSSTSVRFHVVHLTAECWPFAHTGGLGMAVSGLARSQAAAGVPTTVFVPLYRSARESVPRLEPLDAPFQLRLGRCIEPGRLWQAPPARNEPRVVFIQHDGFFDRPAIYGAEGQAYADNARRYAFFTAAALQALPRVAPPPTVLHAHDWHTALAPLRLRGALVGERYYDATAAVLSVHNAAFQGRFASDGIDESELGIPWSEGRPGEPGNGTSWLEAGVASADVVAAVSPTYAQELVTPLGGFGLHDAFRSLGDRLAGIRNGIEPEVWDPATDPHIVARYTARDTTGKTRCKAVLQAEHRLRVDPTTPLVVMCARLVDQKGLDLILDLLATVHGAQFIFLGRGAEHYERALVEASGRAPHRIAVHVGFSDVREHRLLAGADILLMPSLFEPCGLTQMRAQRYGTIPVARRVGGLTDTIEDGVTGFLFDDYRSDALAGALRGALVRYRDPAVWSGHVGAAMRRSFDWEEPAARYLDLYERALASRRRSGGAAPPPVPDRVRSARRPRSAA